MDLGTALSVAQTLFAALQCKELNEIWSFLGYESQLEDLQRTVSTVEAVLLDAESKQELTTEAQSYIKELKDVVYDADDMFDKFVTLSKQKQLIKSGKATKKVRRFFSRHNPLGVAYTMSQGVKKIRKKLDTIARNHAQFGFSIDPRPIRIRREETCSYASKSSIVGRENDVNKIVGHLLNESSLQQDVSILSIVGIGGLGKTALAQLIVNDVRVTSVFSLRIWTCVSDHDQQLDIAVILRKILGSITGQSHEGSNMDWVQNQVREKLTSKRYLLVLDDVWTENRNQWLKLKDFFMGGQKGSWIVITTRSHETARIIGSDSLTHVLQGLSKDDSWCLFKNIAFDPEKVNNNDELIKVGHEIVEGCVGVPLAIRVVANLLYGQDKSKWFSFHKNGLSMFRETQKDIMPILKLSYNQLDSPLKSCFAYCALFPKDYDINKEMLISLWMAQSYVVPLDDGQTMEAAAEDYFTVLLRRCFFQDVQYDDFGIILSCKVHDLMHDIAQEVAGEEICITNFASNNMDKKVRHVAYRSGGFAQQSFTKTHIRSHLLLGNEYGRYYETRQSTLDSLLSNWVCLRALDLRRSDLKSLPESIGKLLHLRYLDLSRNISLEVLPKSFINLYNLQTLKLGECSRLKKLPKDFEKLVNLRILYIYSCGFEFLPCLGSLPNLKALRLQHLSKLEYITESGTLTVSISASTTNGMLGAEGFLSYPSLEDLMLDDLENFKGWRKSSVGAVDTSNSSMTPLLLPQLKSFLINNCKEMKCSLLCPNLENIDYRRFSDTLQVNRLSTTFSSSSPGSYSVPKLRKITIDNVRWLNQMPMESFQCLEKLRIIFDEKVNSLGQAGKVFCGCLSSLMYLYILHCRNLRSVVSGGLEHLRNLETLEIRQCPGSSELDAIIGGFRLN